MIFLRCSDPFPAVLQELERLDALLVRELRAANQEIGPLVSGLAKRIIAEEIMGIPIPLLASADKTFDINNVPAALRPYVLKAEQQGPGTVRVKFKRALSKGSKVRTQTTKGKYGQWSRTGNLLRSESFKLSAEGRGAVSVTLHNNANYSAARSALGGPNPPNAAGRKAGEQRAQKNVPEAQKSKTKAVGNWQERAVKSRQTWIRARYELAIMQALESVTR